MLIQRRSLLKTSTQVAVAIFFLFAIMTGPLWAADDKPNIIVILADDLGFADLGFQGSREIRTPHIDSIAHGGVRFTSGYVPHPFCSPTRAGLLTGRYQQRFGHENNMLFEYGNPNDGLPVSEITLPELLGRALETDRRVAEFKFIHWRGGADAIRQNSLFKDYYLLAEHPTKKRKELFVLDTTHPLKFLRGGRALRSVLSKTS
jgi:hypothetical protein